MADIATYADLPQSEADLFVLDSFPLLDKDDAMKVGLSESEWREVLKMLTEASFSQDIAEMESAYAEKNWDKIQQLARKIKGGASYIGTVKMKMACQYLERYWQVGKRDFLDQLYQQAIKVVHETIEAVKALQ